ncbi:MAG: hypothetical protein AAF772_17350, partial [Acidobacteriota bacterium]
RDVELAPSPARGVAVARCGHGDWIPEALMDPALRTGAVDAADRARAVDKRRADEADRIEASLLETVVDDDPEYQAWCDGTLAPAADALNAVGTSGAPRDRLRGRWMPILAVAAVLLMIAGLGRYALQLRAQLGVAQGAAAALTERTAAHDAQLARETTQRQDAQAHARRLRGQLAETETTVEAVRAQNDALDARLAAVERRLRDALQDAVVVNVTKLIFRAAQAQRGTPVTVDEGASQRMLFEIEVVDPAPHFAYRVRLESADGTVIAIDALEREGAWLRFSVPADQLGVGRYAVRIDGMSGDEAHELDERYILIVEPGP